MNEIVTALSDIANAINKGIPGWVTVISAIAPIVLTCITIVLSIRMDKQNKALQKQIHNRDVRYQTRNNILEIYNAFSDSVIALQKYGNVATAFSNESNPFQWSQDLNLIYRELHKACDRANLLLEDGDFCQFLKSVQFDFDTVFADILRYTGTGIHISTIQNAKNQIAIQFGQSNLDYLFTTNRTAYDQYVKMCDNIYTQEIANKANAYIKQVTDSSFMERFKKYTATIEI